MEAPKGIILTGAATTAWLARRAGSARSVESFMADIESERIG